MISETQVRDIIGCTAYDDNGDKIGKVGQVYLDDETGRPDFVTINTGFFGTSESFVPISEGTFEGDRLTVPYSKDKIKDAPHVPAEGGHLDQRFEDELHAYYGIGHATHRTTDTTTTGTGGTGGTAGAVRPAGHDTSGPDTDDAMTRSEERLEVGKAEREAGRVRLRKYVTTETETETVPVRKERAVVEREPITDANVGAATDGPAISEEEHEVVLHEERAVAEKTAQPVERVRVGKETEVEDQQVTEEVRKEQVEVEGDTDRR